MVKSLKTPQTVSGFLCHTLGISSFPLKHKCAFLKSYKEIPNEPMKDREGTVYTNFKEMIALKALNFGLDLGKL